MIAGLDRLKARGVDWNVLTCVHAANEGHGRRVYRFLRDVLDARYIQLIPVVEREGDDAVSTCSVSPKGYGQFLVDVFEEWVRRDIGGV